MNSRTFNSTITSAHIPSSPNNMAKTTPKFFKTTNSKMNDTSTHHDSTPNESSIKPKPPTKFYKSKPYKSVTYGDNIDSPVLLSNKDELYYMFESIIILNQRSMEKFNVYGYSDILIIMDASIDGIFCMELQLNDRISV